MVVVVAAAAGGRAAPLPLKITDYEEAQTGETTLSLSTLRTQPSAETDSGMLLTGKP